MCPVIVSPFTCIVTAVSVQQKDRYNQESEKVPVLFLGAQYNLCSHKSMDFPYETILHDYKNSSFMRVNFMNSGVVQENAAQSQCAGW